MLDTKCPYLNSVIPPGMLVTLAERERESRLPAGKNNPIRGSTLSFTREVTNPEAA